VQFLGAEKRFYTAWVKRRNTRREQMSSALSPIADMPPLLRHVGFVP
jgi:hypothetical protein